MQKTEVAIIGAGPAGLTAAYLLAKQDIDVIVLEADPIYVGGISRTVVYKGCHFDIGGHRFFSKSQEVEDFWTEILPNMLVRDRYSRIFYREKFFSYPLKPFEALFNLGVRESILCVLSFIKARCFPINNPQNFEDWVSNEFGRRLFRIFFKTYTEKVWGMPCNEISADWSAQRIHNLSLGSAILNALLPNRKFENRQEIIKTLIDSFRYPKKGPGQLWEACSDKIQKMGGKIELGREVVGCTYNNKSHLWTITTKGDELQQEQVQARHLISTAPMRHLVNFLEPGLSAETMRAAEGLRYRGFLTVALILKNTENLKDNWIYVHDPEVEVGRIQNFKAWSPEMVPDPDLNVFGLEYFCAKNDDFWNTCDEDLIKQAKEEIHKIGLAKRENVVDGCVVRQQKAYPIYDSKYAVHVNTIRQELETKFSTLYLIGRNGMHKYNNQDHAMMTAMLAVENIIAGKRIHDVWLVNEDAEYLESGSAGDQKTMPSLQRNTMKVEN